MPKMLIPNIHLWVARVARCFSPRFGPPRFYFSPDTRTQMRVRTRISVTECVEGDSLVHVNHILTAPTEAYSIRHIERIRTHLPDHSHPSIHIAPATIHPHLTANDATMRQRSHI